MKKLTKSEILNLVAFSILMENGGGILDKAPQYIQEKYNKYVISREKDAFLWGLDIENRQKLEKYLDMWGENLRFYYEQKKENHEKSIAPNKN